MVPVEAAPTTTQLAVAIAVVALLLVPRAAFAQDTNYWTIQYGPVGQLVGGQLIGGVPDLSATFYNPGALSLRNESSYLLSTESVQLQSVSTQAKPGQEVLNTSSSAFGAAPSLLAGVLPKWLGEHNSLAWSFLTRQKLEVRLGARLTDPVPGEGVHSASESYVDERLEEDWAGLTFAHPLSSSLGLGVTWYGIYRGQRSRKELSFQAVRADAAALDASGVSDFDYSHYRMLLKLGLAWQSKVWNLGVSLTTASLGLFGSGKAGYTVSVAGTDVYGNGRPAPAILSTSTLTDLASDYRSPWAVGFGASRQIGRTRVYASAEWYAPVERFTVLTGAQEASGATLGQQLRGVFNAGLGVQRVVTGYVSVYGAFHTDYTASTGNPSADVGISDLDLYHVSGGLSFRVRDNHFTLGASWAKGSKQRPLLSPIPPQDLPQSGLDQDLSFHYSKITFLLGFVFGS
jgi:hypothetical protein